MMLVIAGLGLYGLRDITLGVQEYIRKADKIFVELYTSIIPGFELQELEALSGKSIRVVKRSDLEGRWIQELLDAARDKLVVLLAPGDPFIATTHMSLKLEAIKKGIRVTCLPAPSVINAVSASTGLDFYKFCRPVTIVKPQDFYFPSTPYFVLMENLMKGAHTLFLLDIDVERGYAMDISEALKVLVELEKRENKGIIDENTLFVAVSQASSPNEVVRAFKLSDSFCSGSPPHVLIIPGILNPVEAEALQVLAGATQETISMWNSRVRRIVDQNSRLHACTR